ncbi:MAG TPA: hypothetical protein VMZ25_02355 [Terriglobales bacterium]|nr:hypothetical protein [Terriglobales bacterium]
MSSEKTGSGKGGATPFDAVRSFDWKHLLSVTTGSASDSIPAELLPKRETERQEVLLALAEINHRLRGNGKCHVCRAPVRAIMRTVGVDDAGRSWEYECLCRRCLEAEKAYCRKVTSYIAGVVFDEYENRKELVERVRPAGKVAA